MPYGRCRLNVENRGWANAALGGWTVTAITVFSTGQPINLRGAEPDGKPIHHPSSGSCLRRAQRPLSENVRNNGFLWFDTACFPVAARGLLRQ